MAGWWLLALWLSPHPTVLVGLIWVLPLPMVLDWVLEHLGRLSPDPSRLVVATLIASPGIAAALALQATGSLTALALLPVALYGSVALCAAWWGARASGEDDWLRFHLEQEALREQQLRAIVELEDDC